MEQNNLSLLNYKFKLSKTPQVEYRAQNITIPGMDLSIATIPTPFVPIPLPGKLSYGTLDIEFLVGENMTDYFEIFNWMTELGAPDFIGQYRDEKYDCSVVLLNNSSKANINITFTDVFPVRLSSINMNSTLQDIQYATSTVSFEFTRFFFEKL
jgi:hypothetical protein